MRRRWRLRRGGAALAEKLGREFSPDAVGENGWTDLHWAAALDLPGLAKELVERGMEVDDCALALRIGRSRWNRCAEGRAVRWERKS